MWILERFPCQGRIAESNPLLKTLSIHKLARFHFTKESKEPNHLFESRRRTLWKGEVDKSQKKRVMILNPIGIKEGSFGLVSVWNLKKTNYLALNE